MTSSASKSAAPTAVMPSAARNSRMIGTCGDSASGTSSPPAGVSRCALYDGSSATRQAGRQLSSRQHTMRSGPRPRMRVERKSRKPRTALTGVPSGAFAAASGTPKKARKYRLAESISSRGRATGQPYRLSQDVHAGRGTGRAGVSLHQVGEVVHHHQPPAPAGRWAEPADHQVGDVPEVADLADDPVV